MRLSKLDINKSKTVYGYHGDSFYEALVMAKYIKKVCSLKNEKRESFVSSKIEKYQKAFGRKTLTVLKPKDYELLKTYNLKILQNKTEFDTTDLYNQIYHTKNAWFVAVPNELLQKGGEFPVQGPAVAPVLAPVRNNAQMAMRRALRAPVNRSNGLFVRMAPNELALTPSEFNVFVQETTEDLKRAVFLQISEMLRNAAYKSARDPAFKRTRYDVVPPAAKRFKPTGQMISVRGGYYHARPNEPDGRSCGEKETVRFPMSQNCDTENFFHSILAFSDTHHDFGAYIQKSELYGVYDKNVEYNKDMLTLKNYLKAVNSDVLAKKKLAEVMNERNRTLIYLARLNNLNVIRDNVQYDLATVVPPNSNKETALDPQNSPTKTAGGWEAQFLGKFYYLLFPLEEREKIYKVNVQGNNTWGMDLHKFLLKQNFRHYFFDMTVAATELRGNTPYKYTILKNSIERGIQTDTKSPAGEMMISQLDTIAKWWDPSSGGTYIAEQVAKFSDILKREALQKCNKIRFERITNTVAPQAPVIKIQSNSAFEDPVVSYDESSPLYVELNVVDNKSAPSKCYIAVPKTGFNITACTALYEYIENWDQMSGSVKTFVKSHEQDLKMLVLSLKRSGDHGQVLYLRSHNQSNPNNRSFLVTGDSLCVTKAIYEKQPVLFAKHSLVNQEKHYDLFFYNPSSINKSRELYIKTNLAEYYKGDPVLLDNDDDKRFFVKVEQADLSVHASVVQEAVTFQTIEDDMNALALCHKYYDIMRYETRAKGTPLQSALDFFKANKATRFNVAFDFSEILRADISNEINQSVLNDPKLMSLTERKRTIEINKRIEELLKQRKMQQADSLTENIALLNKHIETSEYHVDSLIDFCKLNLDYMTVLSKSATTPRDRQTIVSTLRQSFKALFVANAASVQAINDVFTDIYNVVVREDVMMLNLQRKLSTKFEDVLLKLNELSALAELFTESRIDVNAPISSTNPNLVIPQFQVVTLIIEALAVLNDYSIEQQTGGRVQRAIGEFQKGFVNYVRKHHPSSLAKLKDSESISRAEATKLYKAFANTHPNVQTRVDELERLFRQSEL